MKKTPVVYILTNKNNSVLYIGVTGNLEERINQHKKKLVDGFTKTYNVDKLVYYEILDSFEAAIKREKQLKKWNRKWKEELINKVNPKWCELFVEV